MGDLLSLIGILFGLIVLVVVASVIGGILYIILKIFGKVIGCAFNGCLSLIAFCVVAYFVVHIALLLLCDI